MAWHFAILRRRSRANRRPFQGLVRKSLAIGELDFVASVLLHVVFKDPKLDFVASVLLHVVFKDLDRESHHDGGDMIRPRVKNSPFLVGRVICQACFDRS